MAPSVPASPPWGKEQRSICQGPPTEEPFTVRPLSYNPAWGSQAVLASVNPFADKEAQISKGNCPGYESEAIEHEKAQSLSILPTLSYRALGIKQRPAFS